MKWLTFLLHRCCVAVFSYVNWAFTKSRWLCYQSKISICKIDVSKGLADFIVEIVCGARQNRRLNLKTAAEKNLPWANIPKKIDYFVRTLVRFPLDFSRTFHRLLSGVSCVVVIFRIICQPPCLRNFIRMTLTQKLYTATWFHQLVQHTR